MSTTTEKTDQRSFKEAYGVLQQHANTLRRQTEPNIDDLLGIVTESVSAFKICKARITAVEQALAKALEDPDVQGAVDGDDDSPL